MLPARLSDEAPPVAADPAADARACHEAVLPWTDLLAAALLAGALAAPWYARADPRPLRARRSRLFLFRNVKSLVLGIPKDVVRTALAIAWICGAESDQADSGVEALMERLDWSKRGAAMVLQCVLLSLGLIAYAFTLLLPAFRVIEVVAPLRAIGSRVPWIPALCCAFKPETLLAFEMAKRTGEPAAARPAQVFCRLAMPDSGEFEKCSPTGAPAFVQNLSWLLWSAVLDVFYLGPAVACDPGFLLVVQLLLAVYNYASAVRLVWLFLDGRCARRAPPFDAWVTRLEPSLWTDLDLWSVEVDADEAEEGGRDRLEFAVEFADLAVTLTG